MLFKQQLFAPERFVHQELTDDMREEVTADSTQGRETALWYIGIAAALVLILGIIAAFFVL